MKVILLLVGTLWFHNCHSLYFLDTPEGNAMKKNVEDSINHLWKQSKIGGDDDSDHLITADTFGDGLKIQGAGYLSTVENRTIHSFQGLKYATAERFKIPQAPEVWDGTYDATELQKQCLQYPYNRRRQTEDCLYANVYTPQLPARGVDPLPVMVFIHGGAFVIGSSNTYFPNRLLDHDVVLVTINYRLASFGFFTLDNDDAPGNYALYDQREALRWVNKHIEDFGGDKNTVTVMGESAGSVSASYMSLLADSDTVHRAISESGTTMEVWSLDTDPMTASYIIAEKVGCYGDEYAEIDIECMIDVDEENIVNACNEMIAEDRKNGLLGFRGVSPSLQPIGISESILTKTAQQYYEDGDALDIPYLLGVNKQEGSLITLIVESSYLRPNDLFNNSVYLREEAVKDVLASFGVQDDSHGISNSLILQYCSEFDLGDYYAAAPCLIDMFGVMFLRAGGWKVANYHSLCTTKNTYFYSFDHVSMYDFTSYGHYDKGVTHALELMYLFPMFPLFRNDFETSQRMTLMWTNFAIYGNPTPKVDQNWSNLSIPEWVPYKFEDHHYMLIRDELIMQNEFPLRWTITVDEFMEGGEEVTYEPPCCEEDKKQIMKEAVNKLEQEVDQLYRTKTEKDIDDIEDTREAYMISMIIFIITFVIATGLAIFFFIRLRNKQRSIV